MHILLSQEESSIHQLVLSAETLSFPPDQEKYFNGVLHDMHRVRSSQFTSGGRGESLLSLNFQFSIELNGNVSLKILYTGLQDTKNGAFFTICDDVLLPPLLMISCWSKYSKEFCSGGFGFFFASWQIFKIYILGPVGRNHRGNGASAGEDKCKARDTWLWLSIRKQFGGTQLLK